MQHLFCIGRFESGSSKRNIKIWIAFSRSNGPAPPISSSGKEAEFQTDEEELAKETEWIRVKHKGKKRKMIHPLQ
jgi:hypothetical protein